MWSTACQLQRIWSPLFQAALKLRPSYAQNENSSTFLRRSFHLLAVSGLRKSVSLQHRIQSPIAADQSPGMLCNPNGLSSPMAQPSCGFKLKRVLKRRCKDCYFVVREDRLHVICKTHPRHKQMAIVKPDKSNWILTHATQSKVRPY